MIGGKRRGSVVPPPSSSAKDGGGGVAGGKCDEADNALPSFLESPSEEEQLQKTPAKAAANGDDAGAGYDEEEKEEEEEEELEEGNKEHENNDLEIEGGEAGAGDEEPVERPKLAEGFYLIEAVRKKRIRKGKVQYFVKWRDWPESANTWEPSVNLKTVPDVIAAFEAKRSHKRKTKNSNSSSQARKKQQKRTSTDVPAEKLKIIEKIVALNPGVTNDMNLAPSGIENNDVIETSDKAKQPVEHIEQSQVKPQEAELTGQNAVANGSDKTESAQGLENARCTRRRKSGPVKRFKLDPNPNGVNDLEKAALNGMRSVNLDLTGNTVGFNDKKDMTRRNICHITEIIRPTNFTSYMTNNTMDVCVTFLVKRSDGKEMTVDNKFLRSHFPVLLLDFYEQRLRCNV